MSNLHEHARANALPSDSATAAEYLSLNADIYRNPKHPLNDTINREYQALLRAELGPEGEKMIGGSV